MALALVAGTGFAADAPSIDESMCVRGDVLETRDVDDYTYIRLQTRDGEAWAAVERATVQEGTEVAIAQAFLMKDFWSRSLKQSFEWILFGRLVAACEKHTLPDEAIAAHRAAGVATDGSKPMLSDEAIAAHRAAGVTTGGSRLPLTERIDVAKADGPDGCTVSEVVRESTALIDKPVAVRGRVVKYTSDVMGRNWIHLRDGSGAAADGSNDILVTTLAQARVGDIVLVRGRVRTNQDFGAGYSYKVLIEDATLER
jgi:hypothetical protein